MELLSDNLKIHLKAFLQLWLQEKGEFQELQVTPTHIVLEAAERIESIEIQTILQVDRRQKDFDICRRAIQRPIDSNIQRLNQVGGSDDGQLGMILRKMAKNNFRRWSVQERLETFYLLGEILTLRGWTKRDYQAIEQHLGERAAKDVKKIARRAYELFTARGVRSICGIRPTYLAQMNGSKFYDELLPEARRIASQESSGFAGAHP
jgi:hypothetical protein